MTHRLARATRRRGFTLLESLMASGILLVIVLAVTSAITAGQQHAYEAQQRIAGALAAEDLLGRVVIVPFADLPDWNGYAEAPGTMIDSAGRPLPATADGIGRRVVVTTSIVDLGTSNIKVRGRTVVVRAYDAGNRVLAELTHFVPEPQS